MQKNKRSMFGIVDKNNKVVKWNIEDDTSAYEMFCIFIYRHDAELFNEAHFEGDYCIKELCGIRLKKYAR
jgi:hypothetical protein